MAGGGLNALTCPYLYASRKGNIGRLRSGTVSPRASSAGFGNLRFLIGKMMRYSMPRKYDCNRCNNKTQAEELKVYMEA
jgi:hypothetical protein